VGFVLIGGVILLLALLGKRANRQSYAAIAAVSVVAAYLVYYR
jgi:hypothetical protein